MRSILSLLFAIALPAHAADLSGTWLYDKGAEYFGQMKPLPPPKFPTLQISKDQSFNFTAYTMACLGNLPMAKGMPQATAKCGPVYMPYVATANGDVLSQLIGTHDYQKGGARYAEDYAPPFANKLHPVFIMLPPMKDVLLVRVDDLEQGPSEQRDVMSGVFLAIKNGKVTDQLNEGCTITTDYACVDDDGKRKYQLLETGKFQKL